MRPATSSLLVASARPYKAFLLPLYDGLVLGANMRYVWKCPTDKHLTPLFNKNFSKNHLDIGVATGYFPITSLGLSTSNSGQPGGQVPHRITLADLNMDSIQSAKKRILSRFPNVSVESVVADVTSQPPKSLQSQTFKSISMMNLLHCIPGPPARKLAAFKQYARLLDSDGVLFGCTILGYEDTQQGSRPREWLYDFAMRQLNSKGWFDNRNDTADIFDSGLRQEFAQVETWVIGSMLLFTARNPF